MKRLLYKNMVKISVLDAKLLDLLDNNSRENYSKLAKELKTSQQVISYRIKRLVDTGVITSFITTFATIPLGLNVVKIYLQYSGMTSEREIELQNYLLDHKYVNWVATATGKYDLFVAVMVKDLAELGKFKTGLFEKFGKNINKYTISIIQKAYTFPRSYFGNETKTFHRPALIHKEFNQKLDKNDKEIIRILANDSRIAVVDLSKRLGLNVKTVISKIKGLEKNGIIQSYRINLDREKVGLTYYKVFIKILSYNPKDFETLKNFCLAQRYLVHLIECIGEYELELEMEMPNSEKIEKVIKEIRNTHPDIVATIESCEMTEELKLQWIPNGF